MAALAEIKSYREVIRNKVSIQISIVIEIYSTWQELRKHRRENRIQTEGLDSGSRKQEIRWVSYQQSR